MSEDLNQRIMLQEAAILRQTRRLFGEEPSPRMPSTEQLDALDDMYRALQNLLKIRQRFFPPPETSKQPYTGPIY